VVLPKLDVAEMQRGLEASRLPHVQIYKARLERMLELVDETMNTKVSSSANAFLRTELLIGLVRNLKLSQPSFYQYLGDIATVRHEVAILPQYMIVDGTSYIAAYQRREHTQWDEFVHAMYHRLPSFDATGIARIVILPLTLIFTDLGKVSGHVNAVVIDRKHKHAVVVEPHGSAEDFVMDRVRTLLDDSTYQVSSAYVGMGYQEKYPYCATWAPFLAGQIVLVAIQDDVSVKTAALGLDCVLVATVAKLVGGSKRKHHYRSVRIKISAMARLLAATTASKFLQDYGPGGSHAGSVLREILPDLITRAPLLWLNRMLKNNMSFVSASPSHNAAILEWYYIMHSRPRCAMWRAVQTGSNVEYKLTPGFKPAVLAEASSAQRKTMLQTILSPSGTAANMMAIVLKVFAYEGTTSSILKKDEFIPKIPPKEANGPYLPSAASQEVAEMFGITSDSASHYDVFGKGAEIALRRSKVF